MAAAAFDSVGQGSPAAPQLTFFYPRRSPRAGLVSSQRLTGSEEWLKVKLDPEERVIATALDQAELDDPNERGAEAWIEFRGGARGG